MRKRKTDAWFIDQLLLLFRDAEDAEVTRILEMLRKNDKLRREGYGWKRVRVGCDNPKCYWEGKRTWGERMFQKPCPQCKIRFKSGKTTIFCPVHAVKRKEGKMPKEKINCSACLRENDRKMGTTERNDLSEGLCPLNRDDELHFCPKTGKKLPRLGKVKLIV